MKSFLAELENKEIPLCVICKENPIRELYKTCSAECLKQYRKQHRKQYYLKNKIKIKQNHKQYKLKNKIKNLNKVGFGNE